MKMIFMGTPDFAAGILEALIKAGHEVLLAVTQPDKPKGRGKAVQFPAVKETALAHDIEVYQPKRIREPECAAYLRKYQADIMVVAAFGQILPTEILEMTKYGCVNVHASLLPKYRGAAPIQWAVIDGEKTTGVTTMQMDAGIDTGDMLEKIEIPLAGDETGGSLFEKLAKAGAKLCVQTLAHIEDGTAVRTKQDEASATYAGMISKSMGNIDWTKPAVQIERLIRGLNPWPSAFTSLDGRTLKIWKADVVDADAAMDIDRKAGSPSKAGSVVLAGKKQLVVQTGEGKLALQEVQLEGKKRMPVDAFLRGYQIEEGRVFG